MKELSCSTVNEVYEKEHDSALSDTLRTACMGGNTSMHGGTTTKRYGSVGAANYNSYGILRFSNNVGDYTNVDVNARTLSCGCVNFNGTTYSTVNDRRVKGMRKTKRNIPKREESASDQVRKKYLQSDTKVRDHLLLRPCRNITGSNDIVHSLRNYYADCDGSVSKISDVDLLFCGFADTVNYMRMDIIKNICCKYWHPMREHVDLLSLCDILRCSVYTTLVYKINRLTDLFSLYNNLPAEIVYKLRVYRDAHLPLALYIESKGACDDVALTHVIQCSIYDCACKLEGDCTRVCGTRNMWTIKQEGMYSPICLHDIITTETVTPKSGDRCSIYLKATSDGTLCFRGCKLVDKMEYDRSELSHLYNCVMCDDGVSYDVLKIHYAKQSPLDIYLPSPGFYFCEETLPDLSPIICKIGYWEDRQGYPEGGMSHIYGKSFDFLCHIFFKTLPSRCKVRGFGTTLEGYVCVKVIFDALRIISLVSLLGNYRSGVWKFLNIQSRIDAMDEFIFNPVVGSLVEMYRKGNRIPLYQLREYMVNSVPNISSLGSLLYRTYDWTNYTYQVHAATNLKRSLFSLGLKAMDINTKLACKTKPLLETYYRKIEQNVSRTLMKVIQTKFSPKGETILTTVNGCFRKCIRTIVKEFNVEWRPLIFEPLVELKFITKSDLEVVYTFTKHVTLSSTKKTLENVIDGLEPEVMVVLWYYCYEYHKMATTRVYWTDLFTFAQQTEALRAKYRIPMDKPINSYYCLHPWCPCCNQLKSFVISNVTKGKCANRNRAKKSWYSYGSDRVRINTVTGKYYCGDKKTSNSATKRYRKNECDRSSGNNTGICGSIDHRDDDGSNDGDDVVDLCKFRDDTTRSSVFGRKENDCGYTEVAWVFMPGTRIVHGGKTMMLCPRCTNSLEYTATDKDVLGIYCKQCNVKTGTMESYIFNKYGALMNMNVKGRKKNNNVVSRFTKEPRETDDSIKYYAMGAKSDPAVLESSKYISKIISERVNVVSKMSTVKYCCAACDANIFTDEMCKDTIDPANYDLVDAVSVLVPEESIPMKLTTLDGKPIFKSSIFTIVRSLAVHYISNCLMNDSRKSNNVLAMLQKYFVNKSRGGVTLEVALVSLVSDIVTYVKTKYKRLNAKKVNRDIYFRRVFVCKRHLVGKTQEWYRSVFHTFPLYSMVGAANEISLDRTRMESLLDRVINDVTIAMVDSVDNGHLRAQNHVEGWSVGDKLFWVDRNKARDDSEFAYVMKIDDKFKRLCS